MVSGLCVGLWDPVLIIFLSQCPMVAIAHHSLTGLERGHGHWSPGPALLLGGHFSLELCTTQAWPCHGEEEEGLCPLACPETDQERRHSLLRLDLEPRLEIKRGLGIWFV